MQTRDQGKRPKDWKVVAAIATASALGISGLALAGPSEGRDTPDPINLRDRTNITEVTTPSSAPIATSISGAVASDSRNSLDSPFDDTTTTTTTIIVVDPTDPVVSSSADSPDVTSPPAPAPEPDPAPPPAGSADSGSADSGSAGSADNSADS